MSTNETSKVTSELKGDDRYKYAKNYLFCGIASFIIFLVLVLIHICIVKNVHLDLFAKFFWCLTFTLLGFRLLVQKICINSLHNLGDNSEAPAKNENTERTIAIKEGVEITINVDSIINKKPDDSEATKQEKNRLRYISFYPIMIIVLAVLSTSVSINHFQVCGIQYLIASALLSFFLGFFIDSLSNVFEKLSKALTS